MKTRKKLLAELDALASRRSRERLARQIAPMLIHLVGIHPHGIDLVVWLASPACCDNLAATTYWIVAQLNDPTFCSSDQINSILDVLVSRMTRLLAKTEAANS